MSTIEFKKRDRKVLVAELEQAGATFMGNSCTCPFHDDKHPSAGVYQKDGIWRFKCHKCNIGGDVWDIKTRNEGKPLAEVLKAARGESGAKKPTRKALVTIDDLKAACPGNVEAVYQYMNLMGDNPEMIVIRCRTADGKTFRQARPCNGGYEFVAPAKPWPLYNRECIRQADTVLVVEGEKCVHVLNDYGIIATTNPAGAGKAEHADWTPLAGKNVILWPDNDDSGRQHMKKVEQILQTIEPTPRISIIEPNDLDLYEKEDVADFIEQLKTAGSDVHAELHKAINRAKHKGIAAGVGERIEMMIDGQLQAIPLPWDTVSKLTKALMPNTVTLLCGGPGASKSFALLQCLAYWLDLGVKTCVYELEEDRDYHLMRALAQRSGVASMTDPDWVKMNPEYSREVFRKHEQFLEAMGRCMWASPDTQSTLDQMSEWVTDRAKAGYRIICIDPITAALQTEKPWISDNTFLQCVKRTARDYKCSIVLVTHPAKSYSRPDMSALAGSAAYSRFAQTIIWLGHGLIESEVRTPCGKRIIKHNRTIHLIKARNGRGEWAYIAAEFDKNNLTILEHGIIINKKKEGIK